MITAWQHEPCQSLTPPVLGAVPTAKEMKTLAEVGYFVWVKTGRTMPLADPAQGEELR